MNEVEHHNQRNQHQDNTDGEGGSLFNAGNAHRAIDEHFSIRLQSKGRGILQGEMNPLGVHAQIDRIHKVLDDFAKSQRDNGQVVAGKAQNRNAHSNAKQTCHKTAHKESQQQCQPVRRCVIKQDPDERT